MKAVIMYHSLDRSGSPISLEPETFARHVRWLATGRVRVVPLEQLAGDSADGDAVALTFDDAFLNFASVAAPLLAEYDLPSTLFVVSGCAGGTNAWGGVSHPHIPTLDLLDWDAIAAVVRDGVAIGAHTRSHPRLGAIGDTQMTDEIAGSSDDIYSHVGMRPATFAYPFGDVTPAAARCVRSHYAYACTTDLRVLSATDDPALLPRLDAYYLRKPGSLESWGSPAFGRFIRRRALARRLRSRIRETMHGAGKVA
jgi:peptidoglycan/xylan/chitin deacetylase (PgdA/CDA1 family)